MSAILVVFRGEADIRFLHCKCLLLTPEADIPRPAPTRESRE